MCSRKTMTYSGLDNNYFPWNFFFTNEKRSGHGINSSILLHYLILRYITTTDFNNCYIKFIVLYVVTYILSSHLLNTPVLIMNNLLY